MCYCRPEVRTPCCGRDECHAIAMLTLNTCPWCNPNHGKPDRNELDLAARIANAIAASDVLVPADTAVAVFVFRDRQAEEGTVYMAYVSEAPLKGLRRWLKLWRKMTKGPDVDWRVM